MPDGYKLKRIMMRPNGVEKQVRPKKTWTYSYDFTTWSVADFSSQWWSVPSSCSITSSWLTANTTSWTTVNATNFPWLNDALQTAKIIRVEELWDKWNSGFYRRWWFYVTGQQDWIILYGEAANNILIQVGATTLLDAGDTLPSGEHLQKLEVDLQNKTASWDLWWVILGSASITDSDVSTLRWCTNFIIPISSNSYIKNIKVTIE